MNALRLEMKLTFWVHVVLVTISVYCQPDATKSVNPCSGKQTCHDCIRTRTCAWCSDPNFNSTQERCYQPKGDDSICERQFVYNPENEYHTVENKELFKGSKGEPSSNENDVVQIAPQLVNLKLRINEKHKLKIQFAQAEDYPVDIYYLMDLSLSMVDDKEKVSQLGVILAKEMQNITSDCRLGFGSFVDKVAEPFTPIVQNNSSRKKFCPSYLKPTDCELPYGFRHRLSLSPNSSRFTEQVKSSKVSKSDDRPEGGFDGLMQAVVCRKEIGWRQKARRLLVYSTDAESHSAGDGKLLGITRPNDGLCHLDKDGYYTHSLDLDYPSIAQINSKVKENSINVIFAITGKFVPLYKKLERLIEGSYTGRLAGDSSNVVNLIKEQYNKITSSVELKDNSSDNLKLTYFSKCLESEGPLLETKKCEGLKVGSVVEFEVEVEVTSCPSDRSEWKKRLHIYPVGINESLIVNLQMLCDCPCENKGALEYKENADECNGFGTYQCGICACDANRSGPNCECDDNRDDAGCRPDNTTWIDCSGRGDCICGRCVCETRDGDEVIEGEFCQCDNFSCDREDGALCSGPEHGVCVCGNCVCNEGWIGPSCNCPTTNETCVPPQGGTLCSDRGRCQCGVCQCSPGYLYTGRYCEKCPGCEGQCEKLRDCVQCKVFKISSEDECDDSCSNINLSRVIKLNTLKNEEECHFYDDDMCKFSFVYRSDDIKGMFYVRVQEGKSCPAEAYFLGIVISVITTIVLIGLATLFVWKFLTTIHDRREFAKFERERKLSKWDAGENPLYVQATSTFQNPTYAGQ